MPWPKKNSYKEFDDEKKFLLLENSPPSPPITFLMARPLVTVERKHTGYLNFFNGTNQIYHADEKKKTSHTDKDESKLISTLKSRQFISGGLI